jgi:two-component system, LytTR family, sensor kinase
VPLREELAWLVRYVSIQRARFGERLEVAWDIDEAALDALVPHLVLQPLVENAFRHGVAHERGVGRVEVAARRAGELLELRVRDNGPGPGAALAEGTGLANTRAAGAPLPGARLPRARRRARRWRRGRDRTALPSGAR